MTVQKITEAIKPLEQVAKINEIIDNLGQGGGGGGLVYVKDCPALTSVNNVCTWTVTHNLDTKDVIVRVYEKTSGETVEVDSNTIDNNNLIVKIVSNTNISAGEYSVVVNANEISGESSIDHILPKICDKIWPVNSIYIGNTDTCPIAAIVGTWIKVSSGRVIQGSDGSHSAGSTIAAGLPNITGDIGRVRSAEPASSATNHTTGAFKNSTQGENKITNYSGGEIDNTPRYKFDASLSNSIYGNSTTVQPPAYVVNIWRRTA